MVLAAQSEDLELLKPRMRMLVDDVTEMPVRRKREHRQNLRVAQIRSETRQGNHEQQGTRGFGRN